MNVLLVGLGRWGEQHLRVLRQLGATVWVADVSAERRAWAVGRGIPPERVVAGVAAALPHVDAVDIVTPADSHRAIAEASVAAGRHCFIEKPLTASLADARAVAAQAARAGRIVQVGHVFRFHPATAALQAALAAGAVGPVRYATARFAGFKRPRTDVGVTQTDAIHFFDLFAHLLARPATSVSAVQRDFLGRGLDDMSFTTVLYDDVPVVVEASYFVPGTHRECVIVGERGVLVADYAASTVMLHAGQHRAGPAWEAVEIGKEELPARGPEPLRRELEAFLAACQGRGDNLVPVEAGVHALEIVEAAARAAKANQAVSLQDLR